MCGQPCHGAGGIDVLRHAVLASGSGPGSPIPRARSGQALDDGQSDRMVALVVLAQGGDPEAFGQLFDHYQPSIYRYLYYRLGSTSLAEDLTSETFFRALRGIGGFRWEGRDFAAWLTTIARNLARDHLRSSTHRRETPVEDMRSHEVATPDAESTAIAALTTQQLLRALSQLPADQQECLVMRFLQGLSLDETAHVLDRSVGAVKQLQLRAVRRLARQLGPEPG